MCGPLAASSALRAALLFGAFAATALGGWFSSAPLVPQLTTASFEDHIRKHKTLLKVYAPWCGHCKELAPKFEAAAKQLKDRAVSLAKLDGTQSKEIAEKYDIQSYPQLLWLEDGERTDYPGARTTEGIVSWVKMMTRPPVIEGEEPEAPGTIPNVILYAPNLGDGFRRAAETHRKDGAWYFVKRSTGGPTLVIQHRNEDPIETTSVDGEASITDFFKANQLPLFGLMDQSSWAVYNKKALVWTLYPVNNRKGGIEEVEAQIRPMMMEVAKNFIGRYTFVYIDTEMYREPIYNMLGVRTFPAIVVQRTAGSTERFTYTEGMTSESIAEFLEKIDRGEVAPSVKSEPAPTSNSGLVRIVVGTTLQEEAFREDKDVLLELYAPWCGHCKALEPEYKKLGQYIKQWELSDLVTVAKMDATANDVVDSLAASAFPTLYFIPAGSKQPMKYEGTDRTSKALWQFIKEHSTKSEEIKAAQARVRAKKASKEL